MTTRVDVRSELLEWACARNGLAVDAFTESFPKLDAWVRGETRPTLKQLERFAKATRTPIGYFFLPNPPVERVPIPDFRTMGSAEVVRPSPDLLETVYICQQRQEWYRDFARSMGEDVRPFVGSAKATDDVTEAASRIRHALSFDVEERRALSSWTEALRRFIDLAEQAGILVMVSGVVGSDNRRKLNPQEFRGFALADDLAPLVFINGADTKAAQMFTLAHEIAHLWLGQSALSDARPSDVPAQGIEDWCNRVAAELLVPLRVFDREYRRGAGLQPEMERLARVFKVSTLVVLRRMYDAGGLSRSEFWEAYERELDRLTAVTKGGGGDFYLTVPARVSKRFARAIVVSTLEGQTLHRDAFRLLGFSKLSTFQELGARLGVA